MAAPKDLAAQFLPTLTPEQRAAWMKEYGPPGSASNPIDIDKVPPTPGSAANPIDLDARPDARPDPMTAALSAANRRSSPHPSSPQPSLFDMKLGGPEAPRQEPRNGDWKGAADFQKKVEAQKSLDNLEGATFYNPSNGTATTPTGGGAAGLGALISKGGRTPASWTTQTHEGVKFSPETEQASEKADESQRDAARWARIAGEQEADREMGYLQRHAQLQETHALDQKRRADRQRAQFDDELGKLQSMTEAAQTDKIPTDAWFIKRDGDKINHAASWTSALGYMLGGLSQGLLHLSENPVNQQIREQIQVSKDNVRLRREKLEDQRSVLGQMARTFGDERQAEEAAWLAYLEKAKTDMGRIAAASKSDKVQANYRAALAAIDTEWANHKQRWDELTGDKVVRVQHDVNAPAVYAGAGGGVPDKHTDEQLKNLSEAMEKAGIPQAYSQLQDIDRSIDVFNKEHGDGDIPGVGPIAGKIPDVFVKGVYGDKAVAARQSVATIKNATRKAIAGASLTENEKAELDKQLEGASDAASLRRVVQSFRQSLSYRSRNLMTGANDKARGEYTRRYGVVQKENGPFNVPLDEPSAPYVKEAK